VSRLLEENEGLKEKDNRDSGDHDNRLGNNNHNTDKRDG
jgi:hypothetical protein